MRSIISLNPDTVFSQDLSAAALDETFTPNHPFKLEDVIFKASQAITETVKVTLDSVNGAAYDTILYQRTLTADSNARYHPTAISNYQVGDKIRVQSTNANGLGTMKVIIKTSQM